jgi:hypothetical protein
MPVIEIVPQPACISGPKLPMVSLRPPRRRDEKLIKVGPLEVPKRDNSRKKLQRERRIGNAMFANARTNVWDHSDFATPSISSSRFASL